MPQQEPLSSRRYLLISKSTARMLIDQIDHSYLLIGQCVDEFECAVFFTIPFHDSTFDADNLIENISERVSQITQHLPAGIEILGICCPRLAEEDTFAPILRKETSLNITVYASIDADLECSTHTIKTVDDDAIIDGTISVLTRFTYCSTTELHNGDNYCYRIGDGDNSILYRPYASNKKMLSSVEFLSADDPTSKLLDYQFNKLMTKSTNFKKNHFTVQTMQSLTEMKDQICAPYIQRNFFTVQTERHPQTLSIVTWSIIRINLSISELIDVVEQSLQRAVMLLDEQVSLPKELLHFSLANGALITRPAYTDMELDAEIRTEMHALFGLRTSMPAVHKLAAFRFDAPNSMHIRNIHTFLPKFDAIGKQAIAVGEYDYYHYNQDELIDAGWGCAYRSFQTICSWLILNGFVSERPVPNHRQIQQALVDYGDKSKDFVHSREWIGSIELSYALEQLFRLHARIIHCNNGPALLDNTRTLQQHFQNGGAPVMIGGGQLAHTILGVDFNDKTGDAAFLILDPHYQGQSKEAKTIISKGFCAWKPATFWRKDIFYNLLLVQPEKMI